MRYFMLILVLVFYTIPEIYGKKISDNESFTSPVKPPFLFSGNFGELRASHFHSGLDFRTQGKTGMPVYAVKDGYISRIGVSPTGYGNALYMNHPDGTTTVYGHLERFNPKLEEYLRENQYDKETFAVNLSPFANEFTFKKGEIIAWSGNSGSSGGPHLHFEVRDTKSEYPYNPLLYGFGITDNSAPKISAVYVYPLTEKSNVGPSNSKKRFETIAVPGGYQLKNNLPLELFGKIGFGIQADDDFSGTGLKCGIYSATLLCDGLPVFGFKMDKFPFEDSRYANSQADYEERIKSHRWVQRLYRQPGNYLNIYDPSGKDGILTIEDGKSHQFEVIVCDAFKNKTSLKFRTICKKGNLSPVNQTFTKKFLFDQTNGFENEQIKIVIPKGSLYENLDFIWKSAPKPAGCYSALQFIQTRFVPLHKSYSISIKCDELPENLTDKALIVAIDPASGKKSAIGGEYSEGWVTTNTNIFGSFSVTIDKTPPVIVPLSVKEKKTLTDSTKLQFTITDNLSGIKSYRGEIDGKWVLFELDAKKDLITYVFDKNRMVLGKSHLLRLTVTDNKGNSSECKAIIYK